MQVENSPIVVGDKNKAAPWYSIEVQISSEARKMLEEYAGVLPEEVKDHVLTMDVFPYPCISKFHFLDLNLSLQPGYPQIMAKLQNADARHLKIACCVGQDLRKLVQDGVDSAKIVAVKLEKGYINAGYKLFCDRETLKTRFINADMLDDGIAELNQLEGTFDTSHLGLCLYVWNREEQMVVLRRVI
ncbi:methyltransferase domain-containing protein [Colletotrichum incanum]|uniref:Methyltransferase domain-containing protein n=1 Tax=Colletotrichum incanum TaxID=1573173 RepID=A0A166N1W3_COLIC|nr:methyltransferase domain-containing protein [Colletotrichum incanum]OHW99807.1 hypothetical protein CSPAE12_01476 [Colletotrichum incanum]